MCSFHLKTCLEAVCLLDIQTESDIRLPFFPYIYRSSVFSWEGLHLSSDFVSYSVVSAFLILLYLPISILSLCELHLSFVIALLYRLFSKRVRYSSNL